VNMVAKQDESNVGRVWVTGFHHVTASSRLARVLKLVNHLFIEILIFFRPRWTADTGSVDTGAHRYQWIRGHTCASPQNFVVWTEKNKELYYEIKSDFFLTPDYTL
jgi:hypothetical protein